MVGGSKKLIVVDDHPVIRDGLAILINSEADLQVVGEANDLADALQVIEATRPDVAIIDVSLETSSGLELVRELKARFPKVRVLVWSMYEESLYAERAIQAGALGYINKRNVRECAIEAIRTVLAGDIYLSPEYSAKVLNRLQRGKIDCKCPATLLTDRELEAFTLFGQGLKTSEIAERMELTPNTIETYRSRIKTKLQLKHSVELVREATVFYLTNGESKQWN